MEISDKISDIKSEKVRRRILYPSDLSRLLQKPIFADSTLYLGERGAAVMYRIQNKLMDQSDPDTEKDEILPLRRRRAVPWGGR